MNTEQFTYWLKGYIELNGNVPNKQQWKMIKDHLNTVFIKITPEYGVNLNNFTPHELNKNQVYC